MLDKLVFLSGFYYTRGTIGDVLSSWEQAGFFAYLLPFLLIFAIVFVLITRLKAFEDNRAISGIIAASVALMAVQLDMVPRFFSEIFPRLGIGVTVLLVLLILVGSFIDPKKSGFALTLFTVGCIIFLIIIYTSFSSFNNFFSSSYWWNEYGATIIGVLIILVILGVIIATGGGSNSSSEEKGAKALIFGGK